ncbi:hypothetical protein BDW42DRAFT_190131 [Aspergillus taichungensis]|uniref:Uncharacterized protein n=1 Tax=Aspergillus taichungensis TaxID=482145 RepID=A0A2J5I951_9EURO|nr:hypothetical protein BDW42DRAFT_190131 [Aspergillus taichungensis]
MADNTAVKDPNQPAGAAEGGDDSIDDDNGPFPVGPWGDRGVTSPKAGGKKPKAKESSLNVRINLDLRADVSLELHAVVQGDITIGLF